MLLRDYQIAATEAVFDYFVSSCGTPLVVLPTGSGKSICIADLVKHVLKSAPNEHCLILSHRQEILQQNAAKLQALLPNTPIGIYSQGLGSKRLRQVTVAGVQSLVRVPNLPPFKLIIIDECFVAGTKISTPEGPKDIESLRCGDLVYNANGFGEVKGVSRRLTDYLIRVEFSDGTEITCTKNHKIFTGRGWKEAGALEVGEIAISEKDLCLLLERVWTLDQCQWSCDEREEFQQASMLLSILFEEIEEPNEQSSVSIKDESKVKRDPAQAYQAWRKRAVAFFAGAGFASRARRGLGIECGRDNEGGAPQWDLSEPLQDRHRQCGEDDRDRDRRGVALHDREKRAGQKEDCFANFPRVVNISRIKSESAVPVFNLHVSGHPSYFANGRLVHNCHLVPPSGEGSYQKIISRLLAAEPDARIVGYSATPFRLGSGYLHEGDDRVFTDICFEVPVIDLVNAGYLSPLITKHANTQADLSGVAIRGGEFVAGQAEQAMDRDELTGSAVAEMLRWGSERKSWLVFCSGIKHAEHVTQELIRAGVNADNIFGNSDKGHRTRVLNNFKNQRLRALVSVDTITTGFDAPCTDMIAFLRPTASAGLWVQALGRGMRISPETFKSNCLVLDFCGNAVRLGPIDNPRVSQRGGGKSSESREAPSKVCPECSTCVATATRSCVDCGYEWPEPEVIHAPVAYSSPVMSNGEPEIYEVRSVGYKKHSKNIGIDAFGEDKFSYSLRVIYSMGLGFEISEWICFGHEKEFARRQADRWWKQHRISDDSSVPKTVEEAINRTSELMDVERITVKKDGKFYRVIATTFRVSAVTESLLEEHGI